MRKDNLNVHMFQNRNRCSPKSDQWSDQSEKKKKKKKCGTGWISEKTEALYAELNEGAEAATSSHSATSNFLQYISSVFVAKNHQTIRSRCLVH